MAVQRRRAAEELDLAVERGAQPQRQRHRARVVGPDQADQLAAAEFAAAYQKLEVSPGAETLIRTLRRDGLHLFNIRYWDPALPVIVKLGESVLVRYDPRNLSKVYVAGSDERYHPIPYADLTLPPITLWEQRAAMTKLRDDGDNAPAQTKIFEAVLDQRALVERANAKTKADFKAASDAYLPDVRARLDRIMMSSDAEAGLDALLDAGALSAILPEVEAMVGFGDGEYTNTTGTHPWFRVGFSPRKAALALYVPGAVESELLADLGPHSTGKGCLYIKDLRAVDMSVLRQIIERGARA